MMNSERELLSSLENLFQQKRFSDALLIAKRGCHDFPSSFQIKYLYVRILKQLNRLRESEEALRELMLIYPNNLTLLLEGGSILLLQNKFTEALDYYNKILFLDPFNTDAKNSIDKINQIKQGDLMKSGKVVDFVSYQDGKLNSADTLPEFDSRKLLETNKIEQKPQKMAPPPPPPPPPPPLISEIEISEPPELGNEWGEPEEKIEVELASDQSSTHNIPEMDMSNWETEIKNNNDGEDLPEWSETEDEPNWQNEEKVEREVEEIEGKEKVEENTFENSDNLWSIDQEILDEEEDEQELTVMRLEPPNLEPPEVKAEDPVSLNWDTQLGAEETEKEEDVDIYDINGSVEIDDLERLDEIPDISDFVASQEAYSEDSNINSEIDEQIDDEDELSQSDVSVSWEEDSSIRASLDSYEPINQEIPEINQSTEELTDIEEPIEEEVERISEEAEIVTESAAEIYLKQGLYNEAIEIYEKLYNNQNENRFLLKLDNLKHQRKIQNKILVLNKLLQIIRLKGEKSV